MVDKVPTRCKSLSSSYLLDPPERNPQSAPTPPGGDLSLRQQLEIAAVQAQLEDHLKPIREPRSLSVCFRHSGWNHNRQLVAASLHRCNQTFSRQQNFANCGSDAYILRSLENPDVYRLAGSACHDRFCLPCAQERSRAIALNVIDLTQSKQIRFLTLTLKATTDPLATQLDKLYASFQALRRRKLWKAKVTGGVAFLEVTWSETNKTWHPHFHILIEGSYLPQQQLKAIWYQITTDSFVVDIRPVRDQAIASRYVTKYASKPFNDTFLNRNQQLDEAILAFKGRKLLLTFGTWRGITLIAKPDDGAWEHVATLETTIINAAHGDPAANALLAKITDLNLQPIFARAPPLPPPPEKPPTPLKQLTFFADLFPRKTLQVDRAGG